MTHFYFCQFEPSRELDSNKISAFSRQSCLTPNRFFDLFHVEQYLNRSNLIVLLFNSLRQAQRSGSQGVDLDPLESQKYIFAVGSSTSAALSITKV